MLIGRKRAVPHYLPTSPVHRRLTSALHRPIRRLLHPLRAPLHRLRGALRRPLRGAAHHRRGALPAPHHMVAHRPRRLTATLPLLRPALPLRLVVLVTLLIVLVTLLIVQLTDRARRLRIPRPVAGRRRVLLLRVSLLLAPATTAHQLAKALANAAQKPACTAFTRCMYRRGSRGDVIGTIAVTALYTRSCRLQPVQIINRAGGIWTTSQ
jgi:hypothetical protein